MHFLVAFALKIHLLLEFWLETQIKLTSASASVWLKNKIDQKFKSRTYVDNRIFRDGFLQNVGLLDKRRPPPGIHTEYQDEVFLHFLVI